MFLYLNDVGPNNGPHVFVKKSHDPSFVASKIEQSTLQVNDFFTGSGRAIAKFAEHIFEDCITELPGNAGMCFMENTYGLHRGKPPTAGMRQIVQVLYATVPYPNRIARLAKVGLERIPDGCDDTPLVKHALRYFLRA